MTKTKESNLLEVTVMQAAHERAASVLRAICGEDAIEQQGFTGGSTTWTFYVWDTNGHGVHDVQQAIWDAGTQWVQVASVCESCWKAGDLVTRDLDPGDPEVGPSPEITTFCPKCWDEYDADAAAEAAWEAKTERTNR